MAILASSLTFAQTPAPAPAQEVEPMLVQPYLGKVPLTDAITVLPMGKRGNLVPLGEICRLLAFGIRVDPSLQRATGFFISEKRKFNLDLATGLVDVDKAVFHLQPGEAVFESQDIYVEVGRLQEWFPIEAKVDLRAAVLMLRAKEKLPIQEEWERERKYSGMGQGNSALDADDLKTGEPLATPYSLLGMPFMDLSAYWNRSQFNGSRPVQGSAVLAGDLLYMSGTAYLVRSATGQPASNRFTLSREDPTGELLGPLHAKRLAIGSLLQPSAIPLAGALPQGTGVAIENYPLAYRSKFATRTFVGLLIDGWSVEIYHNGALIAFQRSRPDGLYEFKDLPLRFGLNQFRLVFHGPLGQLREENTRIEIGSDQPPPGAFYYRLMGVRPDSQITPEMLPEDIERADRVRRTAALLEMDYGLSSTYALNLSRSRVALVDGFHDYTVAGIRGLYSYLSAQVSAGRDQRPLGTAGSAAEAVIRTGFGYSSLTVRRSEYRNGFQKADQSLISSLQRDLRAETALDLSATIDIGKTPFGTMYAREVDQFATGGQATKDRLQFSASFSALNVSQSFYRLADSTQPSPATLQSTTLMSLNTESFGLQGDISMMRTGSSTNLSGWGVLVDHRSPTGVLYRAGLRGTSANLKDLTVLAMATRMTGRIGYGVDGQYSKTSGYTLGIRLQAFFGREPRTGRWVSDAQPQATMGAFSATAYLDGNSNGRRDPGERTLEGTQFKIRETPIESRIQDPKVVFKTQLPRSQETTVQLDESSLEDQAMQSTVKGLRIVPRPGKVALLDFPVGYFGEITGTTRVRRGNSTSEYGGLEIELLKRNGERFKRIRSAYDGFFEFRDLPLGEYILQVTPEETARLKHLPPKPRLLHLDNVRNLFEGQDLTVESQLSADVEGVDPALLPTPLILLKPTPPTGSAQ